MALCSFRAALQCPARYSSQAIGLPNKAYVNGEWVNSSTGETYDVLNPASGALLGKVPNMATTDVDQAIQAAATAFKSWKNKTGKERSDHLKNWHAEIVKNAAELTTTLTKENGKPLRDAQAEIGSSIALIEWYAEEARRLYGEIVPSPQPTKRALVIRQPVGVVGAISPWNFPSSMITRKVGAALAAGCTVVLKPSEFTPYSALALAELAHRAGIPKGVINIVTGARERAAPLGRALCESEHIAKISFTGSTETGRILLTQAAVGIKKVAMELGGNAPFVVFPTANIDRAADGLMTAKFRCSGQTCITPNRIFVHDKVFDQFRDAVVQRVRNLRLGDGLDPETSQGPLISERAIEKVERHVADARQRGGRVEVGGARVPQLGPLFFEPTVITNVTREAMCVKEEQFGPLVALVRFTDELEVVDRANDTKMGLAAYFYSNDFSQVWRVAEQLEAGMVAVNEGIFTMVEAPFAGWKQSGIGVECGNLGVREFTNVKYICMGGIAADS